PLAGGLAQAGLVKLRAATEDMRVNVELVAARKVYLEGLVKLHLNRLAIEPGPGRIDAFGDIRDLLFPMDPIAPDAPVSYPHLWQMNRTRWFHWDGNTTSIIERNI